MASSTTYVQHDIGIAGVERPNSIFGPLDDIEVLDPPYLQSGFSSCSFPCAFRVPGLLADMFLELEWHSKRSIQVRYRGRQFDSHV